MDAQIAAPARREGTRLRLPPAVRSQQILDAALAVFAERGYAAARMDDIALRAGLSKGGLYAHFASKDEVFEALLSRVLVAPELGEPPAAALGSEALVDWLLDELDASLGRPELRAVLRLLVSEAERVPAMVARWRSTVIEPFLSAVGELLARHLGGQRPGAAPPLLAREPWLALSPAVHALLMQLVLPQDLLYPPQRVRQAHRELLLLMLAQG
ncbi:TetR/AcrR family transcriptional regulator [Roseateles saccharophilus]|uniref:TetR family transcriptional regulator n=1 Tax=Roseateles saccharophilus TaxID=304 RepID=A0A4R3VDJ7_ROSSA|nr:TetR/AcrR family transcriptional regulator [Roseateles saccharophilus]MDG0834380.1 TetR/AcrR family transcriptional regulator [Roseateles saccharophilus]TCV01983.1 TetR family transcriptional regulator [Roseateles saccharophilus]